MKNLLAKMVKVNGLVRVVEKGGENKFQKYSYTRLGDILHPLTPILFDLGLVVTQSTTILSHEVREFNDAFYSMSSVECITTLIDSESGESLSVKSVGFSMDKNNDKSVFKATTGARKYGITEMFNLSWDNVEPEDDRFDVNTTKHQQISTVTNSVQKKGLGR
jgi:hypothetical protein